MWGFAQEQASLSAGSGTEDYRYQDLCQENAILKQELSDLYSHLMIIDDTIETNNENSKISSVGRLIVYDKAKKDTEILLSNESSRQKICVLEKELSFQHSHLKDQAAKMKELENKLLEAKQHVLRLELDVINSVSLRAKVKELTAQMETMNSNYFIVDKTAVELKQKLNESLKREEELEHELRVKSVSLVEIKDELVLLEGRLKASEAEYFILTEAAKTSNDLLMETQIQQKKSEVLLLVSQSEARHLERKCESQAKELLRFKELTEKHQQYAVNLEEASRLSVRTEKISQPNSQSNESEDEDSTPLIVSESRSLKGGATVGGNHRQQPRTHRLSSTTPSSNTSSDRERERERQREEDSDASRRHRQRHSNGSSSYREDRSSSRSRPQYHPVQNRDKEAIYGADAQEGGGEDCMCGFFPHPFKL